MEQVVEEGLRELALTAHTCTSNGQSFSWFIPFKKNSLTFTFNPVQDTAMFALRIKAQGFSGGVFDRLWEVPCLQNIGQDLWEGEFSYSWEDFSAATAPVRITWELLRDAPDKEKKGNQAPQMWINDVVFQNHGAVRAAVEDHLFKTGFTSTTGQQLVAIHLGGSGYSIPAESLVSFEAGTEGFLLTGTQQSFAVRIRYSEVDDFKFDGGILQRGGGFAGGGFGVVGFAVGAAASMALNKVTSKSEIQTTLQLLTTGGEILLYTNLATPDQLEMMFSEARTRIRSATTQRMTPSSSSSVADELLKLSSLRESGILSDDEFQAAKARLLG